MSFWKAHVSFPSDFASIFGAIKKNSCVLFLAQTSYALVKSSPLRGKFFRFLSAQVKICQTFHVNFEMTNVKSFSSFASFFIVMTHNSPVNFNLIHFLLWIKRPNKSPKFQTFELTRVKIFRIPDVIFGITSQFSFKFYINIQCHQT